MSSPKTLFLTPLLSEVSVLEFSGVCVFRDCHSSHHSWIIGFPGVQLLILSNRAGMALLLPAKNRLCLLGINFPWKTTPIPIISPCHLGRPDFPSCPSSGYVEVTGPKSSKWSSTFCGRTRKDAFPLCWICKNGINRLPWRESLSERDANTQ